MAKWEMEGVPDQTYWGVRAGDVALVLRDLEPGFYSMADIQSRYQSILRKAPTPGLTTIITKMGTDPYMIDGERGWQITPDWLAKRWPRLPWTD